MAKLSEKQRARLPKSAFASIDSRGRRRLPIYDEAHIRSALGRFNQVAFESDAARDQARTRLLRAAKRFGVVPVGFIEAQLRTERRRGHADAQAQRVKKLPTGVVTFVMTDIEGSTSILAELGADYASLMADVRRVLREKVRRAGGHEVEVHADDFLAAFAKAPAALDAALAIQRRMGDKAWPTKRPVRIRIGIHRGHPTLSETGYIGLSVHAVARVCQAAHGGQVLVSRSAHDAMTDELPDDVTFRSLGRRRLRGFPRPDVIYQVQAPDLPRRFPPLRTSLSRG
ncbi:MAG: adenylate/guanylate cyclase domain-containing protein [Chloroflexota bacterium]